MQIMVLVVSQAGGEHQIPLQLSMVKEMIHLVEMYRNE